MCAGVFLSDRARSTEIVYDRGAARHHWNVVLQDHGDTNHHGTATIGAAPTVQMLTLPAHPRRDGWAAWHGLRHGRDGMTAPREERQRIGAPQHKVEGGHSSGAHRRVSVSRVPVALRRMVEERAQQPCAYCLLPALVALISHEVDHGIAEKQGSATVAEQPCGALTNGLRCPWRR